VGGGGDTRRGQAVGVCTVRQATTAAVHKNPLQQGHACMRITAPWGSSHPSSTTMGVCQPVPAVC
jgi:hypothetical protein